MHAYLHRMFGWALERDIIAANPIAAVKRPGKETSRDRVLTDDELMAVWNACSDGTYEAVVRMLVLTGARLNEVARLRWDEIVDSEIQLSGVRTKNGKPHIIPLSRPALALLEELPRGSEFCFARPGEHYPTTGWSAAKARIDAKLRGVAPWRLHDLRRTVATGLQRLGMPVQVTESVLGHAGGSRSGVVGIYQRHDYANEKRAALEAWGAHVTALIEGRAPGKVLPLRGAR